MFALHGKAAVSLMALFCSTFLDNNLRIMQPKHFAGLIHARPQRDYLSRQIPPMTADSPVCPGIHLTSAPNA
jgi:hypothetical protein